MGKASRIHALPGTLDIFQTTFKTLLEKIRKPKKLMEKNTKRIETRQRILDVAEQEFAEKGFDKATVRDICKRANANVSAINYHFKDKEGLYLAVLERMFKKAMARYPMEAALESGLKPEEKLREYVWGFLNRTLKNNGKPGQEKRTTMIARELATPSPKLDVIVEKYIRQHKEVLWSILGELLGDAATPSTLRLCAISVVGQCMHIFYAREIDIRLNPQLAEQPVDLDELASHITEFSLAGIQKTVRSATNQEP